MTSEERKEYDKKYRQQNKERIRKRNGKYVKENKIRLKAYYAALKKDKENGNNNEIENYKYLIGKYRVLDAIRMDKENKDEKIKAWKEQNRNLEVEAAKINKMKQREFKKVTKYLREEKITLEEVVYIIYVKQEIECMKNKIESPDYTLEELYYKMINDDNFYNLYHRWWYKSFRISLTPTAKLIDTQKFGYTLSNLEFTRYTKEKIGINHLEDENIEPRKVIIKTKGNKELSYYKNMEELVESGFDKKTVKLCLEGKQATYKGYKWDERYKMFDKKTLQYFD
jgi:hypothetical protein